MQVVEYLEKDGEISTGDGFGLGRGRRDRTGLLIIVVVIGFDSAVVFCFRGLGLREGLGHGAMRR